MIDFDAATHTYRLDGRVIPHVTQVTDTLCSYAGVPHDVLERKREIGDAVHYATELDDAGDLDDASLPDEIRGYVMAWRKFKRDTGWKTTASEVLVHSATYRYAGRLDCVGGFDRLKGCKPSAIVLIDKKTTYDILPAVAPQTAAYARAWDELGSHKIDRRFAVQLKADGTYRLEEFNDPTDWSVFMSALVLLQWKKRHNIEVHA